VNAILNFIAYHGQNGAIFEKKDLVEIAKIVFSAALAAITVLVLSKALGQITAQGGMINYCIHGVICAVSGMIVYAISALITGVDSIKAVLGGVKR
jgi:peptidoglycan biosynthesis protein MviN/MurJ (putative lipid II flippase)